MSKNNELVILSSTPGVIKTNFLETKKWLAKELETYKTVAVTEENLKERKADVKMLSATEKKIDTTRKEEKKSFIEPLTEFENNCKELKQMVGEAKAFVKDQTDRFDEEQRQIKRDLFHDTIKEELKGYELPTKYTDRVEMTSNVTNVATSKKAIIGDAKVIVMTLKQAYEKEVSNELFVNQQVIDASAMLELTTPITVYDLGNINYETMDVAEMTVKINTIAKQRADAEKAAIKAAEARRIAQEKDEAERIEREKKAEAERKEREELEKIEAEKAQKEEEARLAELEEQEVIEDVEEPFVANIDSLFEEAEEVAPPKRVEYIHTVVIKTLHDKRYIVELLKGNGLDATIDTEEV